MSETIEQRPHGFRRFWYSRVLSQTAQAALLYGLLVYLVAKTSSAIWPSLFVVTSIVPALVFGLIGGAAADWLPQRPLMFTLNILRALAILVLLPGDLSTRDVFILTAVIWSIHQFHAPAESALLPKLTGESELAHATSRFNLALAIAQLLGMVIVAPVILRFTRIDVLLGTCAALYLASNLALFGIRPRRRATLEQEEPTGGVGAGLLRTGWRQMSGDERAFAALVDSVMLGIGLSALIVIVPQFLEDVLHTDPGNTVFVFAPSAVGLVLGLQVAPLLGRLTGYGRLATAGLILFSLSILAIGSLDQLAGWVENRAFFVAWLDDHFGLSPSISTVMLLSIPAGFAMGLVNVTVRTELVLRTEAATHARVFATQMMLANLGALVPTLATGLLIDAVGVRPIALLVAISIAAGAILGRRIGRATRIRSGVESST